jgi:SPX domain protein involved in polyphosphate accumulation
MRYEIKIPILFLDMNNIKNKFLRIKNLNRHYKDRFISSIYFDTNDLKFANYNIEGISNRYKFRIRWYNKDKNFNYEIKRKFNKLSEKTVYPSDLEIGDNFENLFSKKNLDLNKKVNNNEKFIINNFKLSPKLKVKYLREYYIYKKTVRVTIDHTPIYNNLFNKIKKIKDTFSILEIKFEEKDYDIASNLIKLFKINPKRYSKYVKGLSMTNRLNYI